MKKIKLRIHPVPQLNELIWDEPAQSIPFSHYVIEQDATKPDTGKLIITIPLDFVEVIEVENGS